MMHSWVSYNPFLLMITTVDSGCFHSAENDEQIPHHAMVLHRPVERQKKRNGVVLLREEWVTLKEKVRRRGWKITEEMCHAVVLMWKWLDRWVTDIFLGLLVRKRATKINSVDEGKNVDSRGEMGGTLTESKKAQKTASKYLFLSSLWALATLAGAPIFSS